jgi:hypothetical protein
MKATKLNKNIFCIGKSGTLHLFANIRQTNKKNVESINMRTAVISYDIELAPNAALEDTYDSIDAPTGFNAYEIYSVDQSVLITKYLVVQFTDEIIKKLNNHLTD